MNFSAIRMASRYCPLLTCRSISEIQAALDSSNADRTLTASRVNESGEGETNVGLRPDSVYLLLHTNLLLLEGHSGLSPFFLHIWGFCVGLLYSTARWSPRNDLDIPKLPVALV